MLTVIFVIIRILSNSVANLYQKKASKKESAITVNLASYFIMSLICIPPALITNWSVFGYKFWLNVIFAGILCTVGTIALIKALKIGELSVLAPINSYKSIIGLLGAFFILGETPTLKELACVIFIVYGSIFVLGKTGEKFTLKLFLRPDIKLRLLALICSGVEASFLKRIILMSDFKIAVILWCFTGFICTFIIYLFFPKKKKKNEITKQNYKYYTIIGISLLIMQLSTNYVFLFMPVGAALALFQLSSLVSLYFGYNVFNEKNMPRKITGTLIMIIASFVLLN